MKSIGIITYHHYYNYGTMLQAYALQKKVESFGFCVEIIDFKQDNSLSKIQLVWLRIKRLPVYILEFSKYMTLASVKYLFSKRNLKFEEFYSNNFKLSNQKYTDSLQLKANPPIYDGYVVGSDQTWNPYVAKNPEAFYLTFVKDDAKKGCYAPSLGISRLTDEHRCRLKKMLKGFRFLSCRESIGAKLLSETMNCPVAHVLDPTLLLNWDDWSCLSSQKKEKSPYILTYFLGNVKKHREFVRELAQKTGLNVFSIPVSYLDINEPLFEKAWVGPDGFLSLIKNAEYVCTDSFHGTMFSINFGVNFYSFCKTKDAENSSENSRLYSALELFGLSNRLVTNSNQNSVLEELAAIDYSVVHKVLEKEREKSIAYLKDMLEKITE